MQAVMEITSQLWGDRSHEVCNEALGSTAEPTLNELKEDLSRENHEP